MELVLLRDTETVTCADRVALPSSAAVNGPMQELRSRIYFVTPEPEADGQRVAELVRRAVAGGVGIIQYRAKDLGTRAMVEQVASLLQITRPARVPLIVNDRVDVALAVGADGVHVGADDMPVAIARRLLGPRAIVGATVESEADTRLAQRDVATYVAIGAIFASPTKPDLAAVGVEAVSRIRSATSLPLCAIGGITAANIADMADNPPDLVAVVSAIADAPDPAAATRELDGIVKRTWKMRRPPP